MNAAYRDAIGSHGATLVTHIALVDSSGVEVGDGRKAVTWTAPSDGVISPTADIEFNMTAGEEVAAWKGFSDLTDGTDYDGAALTVVEFGNDGTYTLLASSTNINHADGS